MLSTAFLSKEGILSIEYILDISKLSYKLLPLTGLLERTNDKVNCSIASSTLNVSFLTKGCKSKFAGETLPPSMLSLGNGFS